MPELPTNTVYDREPWKSRASEDALDLMKSVILSAPLFQPLLDRGMTPTEVIDAFEELRAAGLMKIVVLGPDRYVMKATDAFLEKMGLPKE